MQDIIFDKTRFGLLAEISLLMQNQQSSHHFHTSRRLKRALFSISTVLLLVATCLWALQSPLLIFAIVKVSSVLILAFSLYKIEKQPLPTSMMYGVLSLLLLGTTFTPFSLNIAEATSYGLEFIVFFLAIICIAKAKLVVNNAFFWLGILLTALVFYANLALIPLMAITALLITATYAIWRNWKITILGIKWLCVNAIGIGVMALASAVTRHLFSNHDFFVTDRLFKTLNSINSLEAQTSQNSIIQNSFTFTPSVILILITSIMTVIVGTVMTALFVRATLVTKPPKSHKLPTAPLVSIMLIFTGATAIGLYLLQYHTASYLFFAVLASIYAVIFSSLTYSKTATVSIPRLLVISMFASMLIVGCMFAMSDTAIHTRTERLSTYGSRNQDITDALKNHRVSNVVGDYWRLLPLSTKFRSHNLTVAGSDACSQYTGNMAIGHNRETNDASLAYILTLDNPQAPNCNLVAIEKEYGQPNSSLIIAGSPNHPKELLLFYDKGKNTIQSKTSQSTPRAPRSIAADVSPACSDKTILVSVAHEDDDILFMNPDINAKIAAGFCIRTIFMTAGDNGAGNFHWLRRKQGSQAAYSTMLGNPDLEWVEKTIQIDKSAFLTIASPKQNPNVSLIFLNVPDGNLAGQGFDGSANQSLANLWNNKIGAIQTVDGQSKFTAGELSNALATLMQTYHPQQIWTQGYTYHTDSDHSDHHFAGQFTKKAYDRYVSQFTAEQPLPPLYFYIGYAIRALPENLTPEESFRKRDVFESYARFDMTICRENIRCSRIGTYDAYLFRQYREDQLELSK